MSQSPITVTYSLEQILGEIKDSIKEVNQKIDRLQQDVNQKFDHLQQDVNQKIDNLQQDVNQKFDTVQKDGSDLKVGQAKLIEKVEGMDKRLEKLETEQATLVKDIADLKGVKSLIIPIVVAVITAVLTVFVRSLPNP
jgi:chromosome segregation ATPase